MRIDAANDSNRHHLGDEQRSDIDAVNVVAAAALLRASAGMVMEAAQALHHATRHVQSGLAPPYTPDNPTRKALSVLDELAARLSTTLAGMRGIVARALAADSGLSDATADACLCVGTLAETPPPIPGRDAEPRSSNLPADAERDRCPPVVLGQGSYSFDPMTGRSVDALA